tara:strand:- start:1655 stop:1843 length:189 start_codon:yes stop_codon:yes gene_type:complete
MERERSLPTAQLTLKIGEGFCLGDGVGGGVGTDRVGGNDAKTKGLEVSHGVGLVVYSVIVAG